MDKETLNSLVLPRHIGIIMDGNGRWATKRGLERPEGHKAGAEAFRRICDYACELGIQAVTFYAFSTENWKRPEKEVNTILDLFRAFLIEAQERKAENEQKGMNIHFLGDRSILPDDIIELFNSVESGSSDKTRTIVNLAVNYGGRAEITTAVKAIAQKVKDGGLDVEDIDEDTISDNLYTSGMPDPDMIIRPGGESRISNFLIWQSAYAEFWFTDIYWPDFTEADLDEAIISFCRRNRRFGGI